MLKPRHLKKNVNVTVLLVDDEIKFTIALAGYLRLKGIKVLTAKSSEMALQILEKNTPDLLIIDVLMPTKTGYDLIKEIQNQNSLFSIPFIFLTAKGMTKDRIKGYHLGCRTYITKPFDPEELIAVIFNIFAETQDIQNVKKISNEIRKVRKLIENKDSAYVKFTSREKKILLEVLEGTSNQTIGEKMKISIRSVERHITRLFSKTGTTNRLDLIRYAYKFHKDLRANDENRTRE